MNIIRLAWSDPAKLPAVQRDSVYFTADYADTSIIKAYLTPASLEYTENKKMVLFFPVGFHDTSKNQAGSQAIH
jgi:hydrogenase maturation factor